MCDDCIHQSPKIYDSLIANIWLPSEKGFCRQPLRLTQEGADPWIVKGTRDLMQQGVARTVFRRVNKGGGQWEAVAASSSNNARSQRLMCYVCGEFKLPQATCGRPCNGPLYSSDLVVSDTANPLLLLAGATLEPRDVNTVPRRAHIQAFCDLLASKSSILGGACGA